MLSTVLLCSFAQPGPPLSTWMGFPAHSYGAAWTAPLLLTASLFLGPLLLQLLDALHAGRQDKQPGVGAALRFAWARLSGHWDGHLRWESLRNLLVAPVCEEIMFRGVVLALLVSGGWGCRSCVLLSPLLFGLAHVHHLFSLTLSRGMGPRQAALVVLFQLAYTTLFGAYASALFLRTGHMLAVVLAHTWCNLLGFPELRFLHPSHRLHPRRHAVLAVFVAGIVVFSLALLPLTDDQWLYSAGATDGHTHAEGLHDSGSWLLHYQRMHQQGAMDKFVPTL